MNNKGKTVIVLGSPRSGTSMTAGILSILGVDMGNIRKPDSSNPKGYFEDLDFQKLGKIIYEKIDKNASGFNLPNQEKIIIESRNFQKEAYRLIQLRKKSKKTEIWGWKTISTNTLINLYLSYLENPFFIVVIRNPISVGKSINKYSKHKSKLYDKISTEEGIIININYIERIMDFYFKNRNLPFLFINFEDLVNNTNSVIKIISNFIDIQNKNKLKKAENFVSSDRKMKYRKSIVRFKEKLKKYISI